MAIANAGYTGKVKIGMDVAASEFLTEDKMYDLDFKTEGNDGSQKKSGEEMIAMYKEFCAVGLGRKMLKMSLNAF